MNSGSRATEAETVRLRRDVLELQRRVAMLERQLEAHQRRWEASEALVRRRLLVEQDRRIIDVRQPPEREPEAPAEPDEDRSG